jgi:hypothetical protein
MGQERTVKSGVESPVRGYHKGRRVGIDIIGGNYPLLDGVFLPAFQRDQINQSASR